MTLDANWYFELDGRAVGPIPEAELIQRLRRGEIGAETRVWRAGQAGWLPFTQAGIMPAALAAPDGQAWCAECGVLHPMEELLEFSGLRLCAGCKPRFFQKLREGKSTAPADSRYLMFGLRAAARIIDYIILSGATTGLLSLLFIGFMALEGKDFFQRLNDNKVPVEFFQKMLLIYALFGLAAFAMQAAYGIVFLKRYGATPGKMILGLKVIRAGGGTLGWGVATGRFFADLLSGMICYIGYLLALFDDEGRALHDQICGTRVVRK